MVEELDLLLQLLGDPVATSRIVYDHDEPAAMADEHRCEVMRSIACQREWSTDRKRSADSQAQAAQLADRLGSIPALHREGHLTVLDLHDQERDLFGQLTSPIGRQKAGMRIALHPGEAACIALAVTRGLVLATDDTDALRALEKLAPEHRYERSRKLLIRAGEIGLRSRTEANAIHAEMRRFGFWDTGRPFPD